MTLDTFHQEVASLRDFLSLLETEPTNALFALNMEQAAKSVVFCARELSEVDKSRGAHG